MKFHINDELENKRENIIKYLVILINIENKISDLNNIKKKICNNIKLLI